MLRRACAVVRLEARKWGAQVAGTGRQAACIRCCAVHAPLTCLWGFHEPRIMFPLTHRKICTFRPCNQGWNVIFKLLILTRLQDFSATFPVHLLPCRLPSTLGQDQGLRICYTVVKIMQFSSQLSSSQTDTIIQGHHCWDKQECIMTAPAPAQLQLPASCASRGRCGSQEFSTPAAAGKPETGTPADPRVVEAVHRKGLMWDK